MLINNYKFIEIINTGSFGTVYKCIKNNIFYAIKIDTDYSITKYETNIYKDLKNVNNISRLIDFFSYDNKYFLVLEYFEMNLEQYKRQFFNSKDYLLKIKKLFLTLIDTVASIHYYGILHRDIKPSNICFNNNLEPYIIDFGLAKKYLISKTHISEKKIKSIIGSYNFASLNIIKLIEPSRRDDLESLIYIYIYLLLSDDDYVKYTNINIENNKSLDFISNILSIYIDNENVKNNIYNTLLYIRRLNFKQSPNYNLIKTKLFN